MVEKRTLQNLPHLEIVDPNKIQFERDERGNLMAVYQYPAELDHKIERVPAEDILDRARNRMMKFENDRLRAELSPEDLALMQERMRVEAAILRRMEAEGLSPEAQQKIDYLRDRYPDFMEGNNELHVVIEQRDARRQRDQENAQSGNPPLQNPWGGSIEDDVANLPDDADEGIGYIGGDGSYLIIHKNAELLQIGSAKMSNDKRVTVGPNGELDLSGLPPGDAGLQDHEAELDLNHHFGPGSGGAPNVGDVVAEPEVGFEMPEDRYTVDDPASFEQPGIVNIGASPFPSAINLSGAFDDALRQRLENLVRPAPVEPIPLGQIIEGDPNAPIQVSDGALRLEEQVPKQTSPSGMKL